MRDRGTGGSTIKYFILRKFYIGLLALNLLSLLCRHTEFKRMKICSDCHSVVD